MGQDGINVVKYNNEDPGISSIYRDRSVLMCTNTVSKSRQVTVDYDAMAGSQGPCNDFHTSARSQTEWAWPSKTVKEALASSGNTTPVCCSARKVSVRLAPGLNTLAGERANLRRSYEPDIEVAIPKIQVLWNRRYTSLRLLLSFS